LAFDPLVFHGDIGGGPLFPEYRVPVYLFTGLEILMLSFWLPRLFTAMLYMRRSQLTA
jgi:hypothetical protein